MVLPRGDKATSANRKQSTLGNRKRKTSGTNSAIPLKKSSKPAKKMPIIILTNCADEELNKFEILFSPTKYCEIGISMALQQGNAVYVMGWPKSTSTGLGGFFNFHVKEAEIHL